MIRVTARPRLALHRAYRPHVGSDALNLRFGEIAPRAARRHCDRATRVGVRKSGCDQRVDLAPVVLYVGERVRYRVTRGRHSLPFQSVADETAALRVEELISGANHVERHSWRE